jgi:hypothetical protein
MKRAEWEAAASQHGSPFEVQITALPIGSVTVRSQVVGSFAQRKSPTETRLLVFREDPKDAPLSVNLDRYIVLEDFRGIDDYPDVVQTADTDDDLEMQEFHDEYVIILPEIESRGHHLPEVPGIYKAMLESHPNKSTS